MPTTESIPELIQAGFSGLWVRSYEPDEVERLFQAMGHQRQWKLLAWDCARGIRDITPNAIGGVPNVQADTPVAALNKCDWRSEDNKPVILLMHNLHRWIDAPPVAQALQNQIIEGKTIRRFVCAVSPVVKLPSEIEKLVTVVEHPLPTTSELEKIGRELHEDIPPSPASLRAAAGLTRTAAENSFTLSLVRHGNVDPSVVWELKAQELEKSNALSLHKGAERFSDLGGLEALKSFCHRALTRNTGEKAKGVMLLGVPGTGKSAFAKALGNETERPTLCFDMNSLMSKYVGDSESNLKAALAVADAMSPCVLFVDEIEKALAGGASSQSGDSGVSRRLFGALLSWLNDHQSDVFFVGTCNDVQSLPPEFARAERFDATFFLDLPTFEERDAIWRNYIRAYGLRHEDAVVETPPSEDWTGAEIKACCRLAKMLDVPLSAAAEYVVPVAVNARDKINALRDYAQSRCLSASKPGRYVRPTQAATQRAERRALSRA